MNKKHLLTMPAVGLVCGFETSLLCADELVLEEVLVTAQRKEQTLQDVPISVSVIDSETIKRVNITDAQDYLSVTPNVGFAEEGQRGSRSVRISIRGIDSLTGNEGTGQASPIGYYMDELSIGQVAQGTANPFLMDIERIEVLRGPQGTFFGLNALGGALNITTKLPDENFYAEVSGEVGNYDKWTVSGIVNTPISDTFFLRGVFAEGDSAALVENANPVGGDSANRSSNYRLSARWLATDNLTFDTSFSYSEDKQSLQELVSTCVLNRSGQSLSGRATAELGISGQLPVTGGLTDGLGCFPDNDSRVNVSVPTPGTTGLNRPRDREHFNAESTTFLNRITWETKSFTLKSITGIIQSEADQLFDIDGISVATLIRENEQETDAWSQEIRLSGSTESGFDWTVGGVYFESENERHNGIVADEVGFAGGRFAPHADVNRDIQESNITAKALFADVTWNISDDFSVSLGARASKDEIEECGIDLSPGVTSIRECETADTDDFSPKISANYNWNEDYASYVTVSRGYKPAGVDVFQSNPNNFFDEETVWNYEAGFKGDLWDGRARLNAAVFFMEWEDMQAQTNIIQTNPDGSITSTRKTQNTEAGADIKGIELDFVGLLSENWTLSGSIGYLDATFNDFPNAVVQGRGPVDLTGEQIPKAPELTYNLNLEYNFGLAQGDGYVRLEYTYRDEQVANFDSFFYRADPAVTQGISNVGLSGPNGYPYLIPDYEVVNLRAGWDSGTGFKVSGSIENLFDEDYYTGTRAGFGFSGIKVRPHPKLFSIKVTYAWDS